MKQLVEDWIDLCKGIKSFQYCHFYTLFMDDVSDKEIEAIFSCFPNKEELISRMKKWLAYVASENLLGTQKELEQLLKNDITERKEVLIRVQNSFEGNKYNIENVKYSFKECEKIERELLYDEMSERFFDYVSDEDQLLDEVDSNIFDELYNALYAITSDFDVRLFLYAPLLKMDYSAEHLYQFVTKGGVYAITSDGISYGRK